MKTTLLVATGIFLLSGIAAAATPAGGDEHAAHHPRAVAAKEEAAKADQQMSLMRDMHAKMLAAETLEERAALMDDHMKAMQSGMAMMGSMNGKGDARSTRDGRQARRDDAPHGHDGNDDADDDGPRGDEAPGSQVALRSTGASPWT